MRKRKASFMSTGEILGISAKKMGLSDRLLALKVMDRWHEIAGSAVASRSCPIFLRKGRLVIRVSHPSWMQELSLLKKEMIARINETLPSLQVKDIRLEAGEVQESYQERREVPKAAVRTLSRDEKEYIDRSVERITDEELRDAARNAMTKGFATMRRG